MVFFYSFQWQKFTDDGILRYESFRIENAQNATTHTTNADATIETKPKSKPIKVKHMQLTASLSLSLSFEMNSNDYSIFAFAMNFFVCFSCNVQISKTTTSFSITSLSWLSFARPTYWAIWWPQLSYFTCKTNPTIQCINVSKFNCSQMCMQLQSKTFRTEKRHQFFKANFQWECDWFSKREIAIVSKEYQKVTLKHTIKSIQCQNLRISKSQCLQLPNILHSEAKKVI